MSLRLTLEGMGLGLGPSFPSTQFSEQCLRQHFEADCHGIETTSQFRAVVGVSHSVGVLIITYTIFWGFLIIVIVEHTPKPYSND